MTQFSIKDTIQKEINGFYTDRVQLGNYQKNKGTGRYLQGADSQEGFNQAEMIGMIDLYASSKFSDGSEDQGQRKIFLNIGNFLTEVSAKQIDLDTKDFRFISEDYADPYTAIFMDRDFREWVKETYFGEIINQGAETLPKYGTVVFKRVKGKVEFVPLQNLRNEQTAKDLQTASFVIEEHPDMYPWEIKAMKGWKTEDWNEDEPVCVYERYGYVPAGWLEDYDEHYTAEEGEEWVDAVVICAYDDDDKKEAHIFMAKQISRRPYEEAHWKRQHGRWLGVGVMEETMENQVAVNVVANLYRKSLHWSSKQLFQTAKSDLAQKNLLTDVDDGEILEVGTNGDLQRIDFSNRSIGELESFANRIMRNAEQRAFAFEAATGESMPSGTPFRLGVILTQAVNSYFGMKKEKYGLFMKRVFQEMLLPQFISDMSKEERIVRLFSGEDGFEVLKKAAMDFVKGETARSALLAGKPVEPLAIAQVLEPLDALKEFPFKIPKDYYKDAKFKFTLSLTGEEIDLGAKLETLTTIYQALAQRQDPRADVFLEKIMKLSGETLPEGQTPTAQGGLPATPTPQAQPAEARV